MSSVDIIINTIDKGSQGALGFAKSFGDAWKSMATPLNQTLEILGKVQDKLGEAFDALERGAEVNQTTASFERMNDAIYQTPDLLNQMSTAARGTISDMDAMKGILTLTAGQTDEMAQMFAQAAPKLMEIAKASSALNPALGDTAFLYESIATGIKRSSPMILDNLGIIIKQEEAYTTFAASIGKTATELTAAEKSVAILNAVMETGQTIISQAGEGIDSQVDAYARLGVAAQEAGDEVKGAFAAAIAGDMDDIADSVSALGTALGELAKEGAPAVAALAKELPALVDQTTMLVDRAEEIKVFTDAYGKLALLATPIGAVGMTTSFVDWILGKPGQSKEAIDLIEKLQQANIDKLLQFATNTPTEMAGTEKSVAAVGEAVQSTAEKLAYLALVGKDVGQATDGIVITSDDMAAALERQNEASGAAAAALEAETEAIERQAEAMRVLAAATGDYFTEAVKQQAEGKDMGDRDISAELYAQADAAGASASALALLSIATGELSEEQAVAALKSAAVTEKIKAMGEALADPTSGVNPQQAMQNIQSFIDGLGAMDFEIAIHPEYAKGDEFDRGFQEKMKELFDVDGGGQTGVIPISVETEQAAEDINGFFTDTMGPYFEEPYMAEVLAEISQAKSAAQEIIDKLNDIPRRIDVEVAVTTTGMDTNTDEQIEEELDGFGLP